MNLAYHLCLILLKTYGDPQHGDGSDHVRVYADAYALLLHVGEMGFLLCAIAHELHRVKHSPLWTIHK